MTFVTPNTYLFVHYGFHGEPLAPQVALLPEGAEHFLYQPLRGQQLTLSFDTAQRYCTGWHDLATAESFPCPDGAKLPSEYEQCRHCQQKTGFNPAFYNAQTVSKQQEERNLQPHSLYLAHFGPGVVKVGITWAGRGIARLLDQGARSGLIIKTLPTATVARRYEALIAKLPGIMETLQLRNKYQLLQRPYDPAQGTEELLRERARVASELNLSPENNQPLFLDPHYLGQSRLNTTNLVHLKDTKTASGTCVGMIGGTLVLEQDDAQYLFSLSNRAGYQVTISDEVTANEHSPQQISLF